jgi:hypothetical protein
MDITEIGWEPVDWIHLAWDKEKWGASVNMVVKFCEFFELLNY